MTKHYAKGPANEAALGPGTIFIEFDDEVPVRQAERYGERWFSSRDKHHDELGPGLSDQPFSSLQGEPVEEIDAAEFEAAWKASAPS